MYYRKYHVPFCAHFMSSSRGLHPNACSMRNSKISQKWSFSKGQFNQPVVMQKYVSWGATWWMRWWRRGRIMWCSWSHITQDGRPKYVWDHLWIWKIYKLKPKKENLIKFKNKILPSPNLYKCIRLIFNKYITPQS